MPTYIRVCVYVFDANCACEIKRNHDQLNLESIIYIYIIFTYLFCL